MAKAKLTNQALWALFSAVDANAGKVNSIIGFHDNGVKVFRSLFMYPNNGVSIAALRSLATPERGYISFLSENEFYLNQAGIDFVEAARKGSPAPNWRPGIGEKVFTNQIAWVLPNMQGVVEDFDGVHYRVGFGNGHVQPYKLDELSQILVDYPNDPLKNLAAGLTEAWQHIDEVWAVIQPIIDAYKEYQDLERQINELQRDLKNPTRMKLILRQSELTDQIFKLGENLISLKKPKD